MLEPSPVSVLLAPNNQPTTAMKIHQILIAAAVPFVFAACGEAEKKTEEVKATAADAADKVKDAAGDTAAEVKDAAADAAAEVKDAAAEAADKAKDAAADAIDAGADAAKDAADKLKSE
jgi:hypothetical protein